MRIVFLFLFVFLFTTCQPGSSPISTPPDTLDAVSAEKLIARTDNSFLLVADFSSLNTAGAQKLATWQGDKLSIDELKTLDALTAEKLAA